ncbi:spore coat protein [Cohnella terricola]|uniref:Spore coat protein n=1 Tax=Cohnella terricola TaxID=1289167 RepID=A0A559JEL5_9BACL|nr:spore coat protein [Cohnella terricola]TVX98321.1 spore coat protein [Cohnella terricola]
MYNNTVLPEADMAYTVLSDLKRVTREYATAATESVCPEIRKMFTELMDDTLKLQGELYMAMQQNNMYNASSPVIKPELDKHLKQYQQIQQQTAQFVQQAQSAQGQMAMNASSTGNQMPAYQ